MRYQDRFDELLLKRYAAAINNRAADGITSGQVSAADLRTVILDSGGRCAWCGASLVDKDFEIDHLISLSAGGGNVGHNLVMTCPDCNRHKAGKHPARFASELSAAGIKSPLVIRILAHYGLEPNHQRGLFDAPTPPAEQSNEDDTPPYRWHKG